MREIKFRYWNKRSKRMAVAEDLSYRDGQMMIAGVPNMDDIVLMQNTGIKDSSDPPKEIYEGDIVVSSTRERSEIVWCIHSWGFRTPTQSGDRTYLFSADTLRQKDFTELKLNHLKVIGNIYENPELLSKDSEKIGQKRD